MSGRGDTVAGPRPGEGLRVLVIDDEPFHAQTVAEGLERVGYECVTAHSGKEGARLIERDDFDVVLTDLKMSDLDGLAILKKAKEELPDAEVIMITGHGDVRTAVEAIKQGAANYLAKPVDLGELRAIVERAAERLRQARTIRELRAQLDERFGYEGVVGNSPQMHEVIQRLPAIAQTNATVLILGETGTGKDLVARAIHNNSPRKAKPFLPMNCTALNENLLDDELFGHEPGAFTGADKLRKGRFEAANGGTLFLDEIGNMPLTLQAKLLRVLENREIFRIGSNEPIKVNVRVISATHVDLEAAVAAGTFRQDLYHRLKVLTLKLPPLRERKEDLPLLVRHFIKELSDYHGKKISTELPDPLRRAMLEYPWPGNVRELRNTIESMVVLDTDGVLNVDDVQEGDFLRKLHAPSDHTHSGPGSLVGRPLAEVERYYIEQALSLTGGNREEAARLLGIGERTLYRDIQEWKVRDKIKQALVETNGDLVEAARRLNMKESALARKVKKAGLTPEMQPE